MFSPVMIFRALASLAVASLIWTLAVWASGGFTLHLAGIRVASTTPWRPLIVFLASATALVVFCGPRAVAAGARNAGARIHATHAVWAIAVAVALAGVRWGTWTASGPDPYAYVSQAAMWREGMWTVPVPIAAEAPWPVPVETFTPFGYRAAPDRSAALVPMTTPGLPLAMAGVQAALGHWAAFLITPISAAAVILLTFQIGVRLGSDQGQTRVRPWSDPGLTPALLLASSPVLLFMVMWPMTDIPAAACSALVIYLLLSRSTASALVAGLAAGAGMLLRPTFVLIAVGAVVWLLAQRAGPKGPAYVRTSAFVLGSLPGLALLFWVNDRWFGSPLMFGYGSPGQLLSVARIGDNLARYSGWLLETSPLALAGLAALLVMWFRPGLAGVDRRSVSLLVIVTVAACLPYLLYEPFDQWWYLRFLLPAWPAMFVGAGLLANAVRTKGRAAAAAVLMVVLSAGAAGIVISERRGVFQFNERRYATIARIVAGITDPSAVILTVQHSGTIRYYAGRQTLRWDLLDPAWLDRAVTWLTERGRHPYLLIEDWEEPQFETRFGGSNRLGRLSYSPMMAWQSRRADGWIFLFDPLNRDAATITPGPDVELAEPFTAPPAAAPWPR